MSSSIEKRSSNTEMQVISLHDLFETLLRNVKLLGVFVGVFFVFGVLHAYFRAPVFQSKALVQIQQSGAGSSMLLSKLSAMSGGMDQMGGGSQLTTQQYILGSDGIMAAAIKQHHLDIIVTPWRFPIIGNAIANHYDQNNVATPKKAVMGLSRYSWGGDHVIIDQFSIPTQLTGATFTLINLGNNQYELRDRHSLILKGTVGQLATTTINGNTISLMISELNANPNTHFFIEKLSKLDAIAWLKSKIQINPAGMQTNLLTLTATGLPREHLQTILSAVIDSAMTMSVYLRAEKAQKVLSFIDDQLPKIKAHLDQINTQMNNTLPIGSAFANLAREKNIQNIVYTNMLVDVEQYAFEKASSLGDITIIAKPTSIFSVQKISNSKLALIITFVGFLLGIIFIFARQFLTAVVYDPVQVEQITGLNLLAGLQVTKMQSNQMTLHRKGRIPYLKVLSELDANGVTLEGFRSLRTALFLNFFSRDTTDHSKRNNIITINGPVPNVGKSFISVNLAQQLAESGKRTLLIDADIRKGSISEYFEGTSGHLGFVDLLKGNKNSDHCILKTRLDRLDFLPSGSIQVKHVDLLSKENVERVLDQLAALYDFIVIDTAPVLAVSDALSICRHTGINLMVFAHGRHNEREIDLALKKFEHSKIKLSGFVMNFVPVPKLGYGYGYGYGYGKEARE